jgi:hypothetical protein
MSLQQAVKSSTPYLRKAVYSSSFFGVFALLETILQQRNDSVGHRGNARILGFSRVAINPSIAMP